MKPSYKTALVLIPTEEIWTPIQQIRNIHDKKVRRWMPHITLIYPFIEKEKFVWFETNLAQVCQNFNQFSITLEKFCYFDHGRGHFTLWLSPDSGKILEKLQQKILEIVPTEIRQEQKLPFHPHLSVGQVEDKNKIESMARLKDLQQKLQNEWKTLYFQAQRLSLIWRNAPPDDIFQVASQVKLP